MKPALVRFGVAMDEDLLADFDAVVKLRGGTRSEVLRDLARAEVTKSRSAAHVPAVATLTLVYDHHVRDLSEKLTEMQHSLGEQVRSTLHVHLDHDSCLEVIVMRGFADEIQSAAERLLATRGVAHGGLQLYPEAAYAAPKAKAHAHALSHDAAHEAAHEGDHAHGDEPHGEHAHGDHDHA